ncbi:hypothetical protein [Actinomycetospora aeridis]|uniref:Ig-like domain-containing protein n=1 Tax=Actinomycetospora aeridis TaxID=3129231 RepID=A0ABU8NET5_9PSEU
MTDGSNDAAVTGQGRRRPRDGDAPASGHGAATPPVATSPPDAIRRTGSQPTAEAATSMVGIPAAGRRAAGPPTPARPVPAAPAQPAADEAATSMVGVPADATGLGVRKGGGQDPGSVDAATSVVPTTPAADATGLGQRRAAGSASAAPVDGTGLGARRSAAQVPPDATGLGQRGRVTGPPSGPFTGPPSAGVGTTGPGHRPPAGARPAPGGHEDIVRFGPGMPASPPPPATPTWHRPPAEGAAPTPARPRRKRRTPFVGGLLTLLAIAGVLAWLFLRPTTPVGIQGVTVAADPAEAGCGATVVLVGTVATDGTAGTFRYRWERSDGQITEPLTQSVASGATSTDVRLQWTVSGEGTFDGSATLRVLDGVPATPQAAEGTGGFTYAC